jgi:hypothetical protein
MSRDTGPQAEEEERRRLKQHLQPLFYAMLRGAPPAATKLTQEKEATPAAPVQEVSSSKPLPPTDTRSAGSMLPIDDYLPPDPTALRQTAVYQTLYQAIQFQRDQYLVGTDYATWQQREREGHEQNNKADDDDGRRRVMTSTDPLPHDRTALGHVQLAPLAASFIPSDTVRMAALPLVVALPTPTMLYPALVAVTCDLILAQQGLLDQVVRTTLLGALREPSYRMAMKKSTYGYLAATQEPYRDETPKGGSDRRASDD